MLLHCDVDAVNQQGYMWDAYLLGVVSVYGIEMLYFIFEIYGNEIIPFNKCKILHHFSFHAEAAQSYVDVLSNVDEKSILVLNKQKN